MPPPRTPWGRLMPARRKVAIDGFEVESTAMTIVFRGSVGGVVWQGWGSRARGLSALHPAPPPSVPNIHEDCNSTPFPNRTVFVAACREGAEKPPPHFRVRRRPRVAHFPGGGRHNALCRFSSCRDGNRWLPYPPTPWRTLRSHRPPPFHPSNNHPVAMATRLINASIA